MIGKRKSKDFSWFTISLFCILSQSRVSSGFHSKKTWLAKKSLFDCKNQSILSNKKIEDIQKPTSEATKEQVSEELDEQIRGPLSCLIVESALRSSSKRKRKGSAKKENPV